MKVTKTEPTTMFKGKTEILKKQVSYLKSKIYYLNKYKEYIYE